MNHENLSIYYSVAEYIDIGIIALDENKNIVIWNNWLKNKSGLSLDVVSGKTIEEVFPNVSGTRITAAIEHAYQFGAPAIISNIFNSSPLPLYNDNKEKITQLINVIPVYHEQRQGCILQINDVSASVDREKALELQVKERKSIENELRTTLAELEKVSNIKSNFLASMSHEIRTPMNGIIGMTRMLKGTSLDKEQEEYLGIIDESVHGLLSVINDILDFSKIEAGKIELEESIFNLSELINNNINLLKPTATNKNLQIKTVFDSSLKKTYLGDSTRINQILLNLMSNAIKFTETGSITLTITGNGYNNQHPSIKFSVKDTGTGIEEDKLSTLFDLFTQADSSTTRKYGGTGLGLAICKKLVELMKGTIEVHSTPGVGSEFWFTVSLGEASKAVKNITNITDVEDLAITAFSGKVLLVEDVVVNQIIAKSILTRLGFDVDISNNGKEAIEAVKKASYVLIFMDCQMPVMDGYDATRAIRNLETTHHTPIIALTALAMKGDSEKCYQAGMDDYISKPYEVNDIVSCVKKWINK